MATQVVTSLPIHRLDVDTYNNMVESGALDNQPVELVEGLIVDMMSPQSPGHAAVIRRLTRHFADAQATLCVQLPFEVPPDSEPEPDVALLAEEPPPGCHPRTALLTVEVAVTSHEIDRGAKADLYARAGVPIYWLIDVPGKAVEVRTEPGLDGYRRCVPMRWARWCPRPLSAWRTSTWPPCSRASSAEIAAGCGRVRRSAGAR